MQDVDSVVLSTRWSSMIKSASDKEGTVRLQDYSRGVVSLTLVGHHARRTRLNESNELPESICTSVLVDNKVDCPTLGDTNVRIRPHE